MDARTILIIIACICWAVAALPLATVEARVRTGWLGMLFFGISLLIR
jgi:hypothetical protein